MRFYEIAAGARGLLSTASTGLSPAGRPGRKRGPYDSRPAKPAPSIDPPLSGEDQARSFHTFRQPKHAVGFQALPGGERCPAALAPPACPEPFGLAGIPGADGSPARVGEGRPRPWLNCCHGSAWSAVAQQHEDV